MLGKLFLVMMTLLLPTEAVALSLDIIIRHGRDKLRIVKGPTGRAQITFKTSAGSTLYASAWTSRHPSRMHPHALLDLTHVPSPLLDHLMVLRNDRFLTLRTDRFSRDARELIRYLGRKRLSLYDFVLQMLRSSMQRPPSQGNRNRSRQRMVGGGSGFGPIALPPLLQELTRGMPKVVLKYLSRSLAHFGERVISHLFPEPWAEDSVVESQGSLSLRNDGEYDTIHVALTAKLLAIRINLHQ